MSLLSFIGRLIKPRPKNRSIHHATKHHSSVSPVATEEPTTPTQPPRVDTQHAPVAAPTPPPQQLRVTVRFVDQASNSELHAADILDGLEGEALILNWRHFPGRLFIRAEHYTDVFMASVSTITLFYQEVLAAPVSVYHRGHAGRLLAPPELIYGTVDMAFTVNALPERADDVIGAKTQQGVFSTTAQTVRFNYKEAGIEHGSLPEAAYVEVTVNKQVFAKARSQTPLSAFLPEGTVWQVFGLVREEVSHQVWLNLGGNQWITATHTRPHQQNPYLPAPTKLTRPRLGFTSVIHDALQARASVDGPSTGTRIWTTPYGQILDETLANGVRVETSARVMMSDGSSWFQLNNGHYIQASYLKFSANK
jgi:hypothetical protein